jgi:predicted DNA-binding transcriptional regulator YafY
VPPSLTACVSDLGLASVWRTAQRKLATATADGTGRPPPVDLHLDVQTWLPSHDAIHCLPTVALAIRRRQLAIVHARPRARAVVEPLGLVNKTGVWYLVTQPAVGRTRVYRVGRIESTGFRTSRPQVEVTLRVSDMAFGMLPEIVGDQV